MIKDSLFLDIDYVMIFESSMTLFWFKTGIIGPKFQNHPQNFNYFNPVAFSTSLQDFLLGDLMCFLILCAKVSCEARGEVKVICF